MADEAYPSLDDILREAIRAELAQVHTSMPARVLAYDAATQTVRVQPIVRGRFRNPDGTSETYQFPVITRVPVVFPNGGGFSITWPLEAGDMVTLVFAERSIDEWKATSNADNTPRDRRRFDLADAVAYPGGRSPASPLAGAGNDMVVRHTSGIEVRITAAGRIRIGTAGVDLVAVLSAALNNLATATVATALGPQPLSTALALATAKALVDTIKV